MGSMLPGASCVRAPLPAAEHFKSEPTEPSAGPTRTAARGGMATSRPQWRSTVWAKYSLRDGVPFLTQHLLRRKRPSSPYFNSGARTGIALRTHLGMYGGSEPTAGLAREY